LVALGKLSERGQRIRAELVENARDEFSELLVFTVSVDGKGVRWNCSVDYSLRHYISFISHNIADPRVSAVATALSQPVQIAYLLVQQSG
jgi:hypothetical protein